MTFKRHSIKVIGYDTVRLSAYDFLLAFHSNYGPISHIVSETQWNTGRKSQIFGTPLFGAPVEGDQPPLNFHSLSLLGKLEWWAYLAIKKFDGKFSRFDTIHQRDRQTDTARHQRPRYMDSVARYKIAAFSHCAVSIVCFCYILYS